MRVLKFGGSSVATAESIAQVCEIIARRADRTVVVVSAMGGVTDQLLQLARTAEHEGLVDNRSLASLRARHIEAGDALASPADLADLTAAIDQALVELGVATVDEDGAVILGDPETVRPVLHG